MVIGPDAIKLVVRGTAGSREVYDLSRDPQELNDLAAAGHPSVPELADVLTAVATFDGGTLAKPTSPSRLESPGPSSAALVVRDVLEAGGAPNEHLLKALKAVADLQLEDMVPLALPYLTHASPDVRSEALGVLFSLGSPEHRNAVLPLLADPEPRVRAGAARAMGRVGSKGDVRLLAVDESMTSDEQWQRARSRLRLGDRTGVDELATRSGTLDGAEQFFLLSELARLGDAKASSFFLDFIEAEDSTPAERWSALSVLLPAGHPTALLVFQDSIRSRAASGDLILQGLDLIPTDQPTAVDVLLEAALHPWPNVRHRAVAALRRTYSAEEVRTLIHASQDAAARR
jgi:HEAT repeat protein